MVFLFKVCVPLGLKDCWQIEPSIDPDLCGGAVRLATSTLTATNVSTIVYSFPRACEQRQPTPHACPRSRSGQPRRTPPSHNVKMKIIMDCSSGDEKFI